MLLRARVCVYKMFPLLRAFECGFKYMIRLKYSKKDLEKCGQQAHCLVAFRSCQDYLLICCLDGRFVANYSSPVLLIPSPRLVLIAELIPTDKQLPSGLVFIKIEYLFGPISIYYGVHFPWVCIVKQAG